jgi:hypothetical protein
VSILRIYLYGLVVIRDGFVILAFSQIGKPPIVVGVSKPRVYLDGFIKVGDGLIILTFFK